ncbi:MAG: trehalose-phosphatase [Vicinamibacterales bacterium]|nr:trehalose-phosphatase [Vicinamibacterales bacterium]
MGTTDILALRQQRMLTRFATSNVLLACDYDGTLAPIASTPDIVRMRIRTWRLLDEVARRYPTVAISGRSLADLTQRLAGIPLRGLYGNYGAEPAPKRPPRSVGVWARQLTARLSGHAGVVVEDKGYSVTVHYRHARNEARVAADIRDAARTLHGARVLGGVLAVTVLPGHAPDKGSALQRARRRLRCDTAIYLGDDDTDEDAFASGPPDALLAVKVGPSGESKARYHLRRQADIDALLRRLLALRSGA